MGPAPFSSDSGPGRSIYSRWDANSTLRSDPFVQCWLLPVPVATSVQPAAVLLSDHQLLPHASCVFPLASLFGEPEGFISCSPADLPLEIAGSG